MLRSIITIVFCTIMFASISVHAEEELIFEPLTSGNFAVLHLNSEEVFIINTGASKSQEEVKRYLNGLKEHHVKGILITKVNDKNCGNLNWILNEVEVDHVYLPKNDQTHCSIPSDYKKNAYYLDTNERIAISSKYYIDHIYDTEHQSSHVALSNGQFVCYWYEGKINHDLWKQQTQVIFLPDNPQTTLTEDELVKLDPEVAIINRRGEISSLIELFQRQWVDIYALRKGVSAHITIFQDDYELYLKRE